MPRGEETAIVGKAVRQQFDNFNMSNGYEQSGGEVDEARRRAG